MVHLGCVQIGEHLTKYETKEQGNIVATTKEITDEQKKIIVVKGLTMSEFDTILQYNTDGPITVHIVAVTFFVLTGTVFNGIILYTHYKKPNRGKMDIYILTLAWVDLFSCTVICLQYPFMGAYTEQYRNGNSFALRQFFTSMVFIMMMSLGIYTAIALIRVNAVFRPLSFAGSTKRSKWIIFAITLLSLIDAFASMNTQSLVPSGNDISVGLATIQMLLCLILMTVSYLAIAIKLHRHSRKFTNYSISKDTSTEISQIRESTGISEEPRSSQQMDKTSTSKTVEPTNEPATHAGNITKPCHSGAEISTVSGSVMNDIRRSQPRDKDPHYLKTLKMFFAVTVIFVATYIPSICLMSRLTSSFYITYSVFIGNNSNFVVYLYFNAEFRKDVMKIWKRIKSYFDNI